MINFIKNSINFTYFLLLLIKFKSFKNNLKRNQLGKTLVILANGPSLKNVLPNLTTDTSFVNVDFLVLNYFAKDSVFFQIKPKHYCFADPMFFGNSLRLKEVKELFDILNLKVDWNMNIYIPTNKYNDFMNFSNIDNININIIKMNTVPYLGFEKFRNYFYKIGSSMPIIGTVANFAIFIGLNLGYSKLNLYGVDHTFFDSLTVNKENKVCNRQSHFYDNKEVVLKPIIKVVDGKGFKISEYIDSINLMFKSHDQLAEYASFLKTKIINHTEVSLIDSYERPKKHE